MSQPTKKLDRQVLADVQRDLEQLRADREATLAQRRALVHAKLPRIAEIDRALSRTAAAVMFHTLQDDTDVEQAVANIAHQNRALQDERSMLLVQHGFDACYLSNAYVCPRCSDMGFVGTTPCQCLLDRYARKLTDSLSSILPIADQNFDKFSLSFYPTTVDARLGASPRDVMQDVLTDCQTFARTFGSQPRNLLFFGSTGLGKTFLSTAIAKEVTARGFSVSYDTAIHVFSAYESVRFNAADAADAQKRIRKYENSDLLIMDDLGTEMSTQFNVSAFYNLLSTRLMRGMPMIINTNLLPSTFAQRYSDAISSRLNGEFDHLRFLGNDIRLLKKRRMP